MYYKFNCGCVYRLEPLEIQMLDGEKYRWVMISPCVSDAKHWRGRIDCFTKKGLEYYDCKPISKFDTVLLKMQRG